MTRQPGVFANRGVHTSLRWGTKRIPLPTPRLAMMRCRRCRKFGVTVTAELNERLVGWCCLDHAAQDGLCLPHGRETPSPSSGGSRAT